VISKKGQIIQNALDGYDILKNKASLSNLDNIKYELLKADLLFDNLYFSNFLFSKNVPSANIISKQILFSTLIDLNFNLEYLSSIKLNSKIAYPLPKIWQNVLIKQNVKISTFKCSLLWYIFLIKCWINGLKNILKICVKSMILLTKKDKSFVNKYSFCLNLNELALEYDQINKQSHIFLNWYSNYIDDNITLNLFHNVSSVKNVKINKNITLKYSNHTLPFFINFKQIIYFLFYCSYLTIQSFFKFLLGRWDFFLLYNETIQYLQVKCLNSDLLAKDYLFNNSMNIYKPLWTYEAEIKGSNVIYYFYSKPAYYSITSNLINNVLIEKLKLQTWNTYFVWDNSDKILISNYVCCTKNIFVTGPIIFGKPLNNLNFTSITIFDIQSMIDEYYKILGISEEYYIPEISIQFLSDIKKVTSKYNIKIIYKRKRNIKSMLHPNLIKYIDNNLQNESTYLLDPDYNAIDVIKNSIATISMPFTSTAFLGKELNKPSIFYDPTGLVSKNNNNSNGIQIINNIDDLDNWVNQIGKIVNN
jgi:polysaccharide biosynthesis PFTS motif protein